MQAKVLEAFSLQNKVFALSKEVDNLKDAVRNNEDELRKLQALGDVTRAKRTELNNTETKLAQTRTQLNGFLKELREEGIELPLGDKLVNRQNKL
jgi:predicted  nucleic acid-binding Zn-ribbon protein